VLWGIRNVMGEEWWEKGERGVRLVGGRKVVKGGKKGSEGMGLKREENVAHERVGVRGVEWAGEDGGRGW